MDFFRAFTPVDELALLEIGSRPTRRPRGDPRERGEHGACERGLEIPVREVRQAVLEGDRLALLGQLQAAGWMARGLCEDRRVRRPAAAARAAAAAVEDRQLDVRIACDLDEPLLRPVDRPLRGEVAAVLAGVGVADHDLEAPAPPLDVPRVAGIREHAANRRRRALEVGDRLEQRHNGERLVGQREHGEHVLLRLGPGDDHCVERLLAEAAPRLADSSSSREIGTSDRCIESATASSRTSLR